VLSVCFLKVSFDTTVFLAGLTLALTLALMVVLTVALAEVAVVTTGATRVAFVMILAFVKLKKCASACYLLRLPYRQFTF
jgi:hypothetical protein